MKFIINSEVYGALALVFIIFLSGVLGFKYFSEYTWIDAIYMTVIMVATVGYGEVGSFIGYKSTEGEYIVNPESSMFLKKDTKLILIGRPNQIDKLKRICYV